MHFYLQRQAHLFLEALSSIYFYVLAVSFCVLWHLKGSSAFLYGQEKPSAESLDWTPRFCRWSLGELCPLSSLFENNNFQESCIHSNGGKNLMNGKGGTATSTSPKLQVRALMSNLSPDHHSVLSSY